MNPQTVLVLIFVLSSLSIARVRAKDIYFEFVNEDKGAFTPISELLYGDDHSDGHLTQSLYLSFTNSVEENRKLEFSLEQAVFTPENKRAESSEYGDRPFAGYLGIGADLIIKRDEKNLTDWLKFDIIHRTGFDIALLGEPSGAKKVQNWAHDKKGVDSYSGWDDQVDFRLGTTISHRIITRFRKNFAYFDVELAPHAVLSISNVVGYQGVGATFRLGKDLQNDFSPSIFSLLSNGNESVTDAETFTWNLFYGVEGRHIFNNYLLEGETTITDRSTVNMKNLVADIQAGVVFNFVPVAVTISITNRSKEFEGQINNQQYLRFGFNVSI